MLAAFAPRVAACGAASSSGSTSVRCGGASRVPKKRRVRSSRGSTSRVVTSEAWLSRPGQGTRERPKPHAVTRNASRVWGNAHLLRVSQLRWGWGSLTASAVASEYESPGRDTKHASLEMANITNVVLAVFKRVASKPATMNASTFTNENSNSNSNSTNPVHVALLNLLYSRIATVVGATLCVLAFAHLHAVWPTAATVAPAAVFVAGPVGGFAKLIAALTAVASESVSFGFTTLVSTITGVTGFSVARGKATSELQSLRSELAELRELVLFSKNAAATAALSDPPLSNASGEVSVKTDTAAELGHSRPLDYAAFAKANAVWAPPGLRYPPKSGTEGVDYASSARKTVTQVLTSASSFSSQAAVASKLEDLASLHEQLARLRAASSPSGGEGGDVYDYKEPAAPAFQNRDDEPVDFAKRAKANAVWRPSTICVTGVGTDGARSFSQIADLKAADSFVSEPHRELAAARAALAELRETKRETVSKDFGDDEVGDSQSRRSPTSAGLAAGSDAITTVPPDYAAVAKANALWSPGAPAT